MSQQTTLGFAGRQGGKSRPLRNFDNGLPCLPVP